MMITSHVLVGILLGSSFGAWTGFNGLVLFSALGAVFPDLDMFMEHRKTFHRPFQFILLSIPLFAALTYSPLFLIPAVFLLEASVHSFMDVLCNGKTMRPWKVKDDRAVYNHLKGEWIRPLRFFYDGSPIDLAVSLSTAALITFFYGLKPEVVAVTSLSVLYTLGRKKIDRIFSDYDRFSEFFHSLIGRKA